MLFVVITVMIFPDADISTPATHKINRGEESSKPIKVTLAMWELTDPDGNEASEKIYNKIVNDLVLSLNLFPLPGLIQVK